MPFPIIISRLFVFLLGTLLVAFTLLSAIKTFVLPRAAPDTLTRLVFLTARRICNLRQPPPIIPGVHRGDHRPDPGGLIDRLPSHHVRCFPEAGNSCCTVGGARRQPP